MSMQDYRIEELYDLTKTIAAPLFARAQYPWELLPLIGDYIVELGNTLPEDKFEKRGENIWIAKSAHVFDSAYIAGLDSILALEPIKKGAENEAKISMNTFAAPVFKLPGSVTGKKDPAPKANHAGKSAENRQANAKQADNAAASAEAFADKFSNALSKLQSDPSNAGLYKTVEAKDGDDLFKLLKRTYGNGVQNLPRFYILSTLQSVNPGVMLEHLNAGDKVRVPRI